MEPAEPIWPGSRAGVDASVREKRRVADKAVTSELSSALLVHYETNKQTIPLISSF
jgi:hypothetical protein